METMFMQNFGGKTKSIMVFLKVAYEVSAFNLPSLYMVNQIKIYMRPAKETRKN